jgi:Beta-propeller repeat/Viral BACON domain
MHRRTPTTCYFRVVSCFLFVALGVAPGHVQRPRLTATSAPSRLAANYGKLPLRFEANLGQADPRVRFISRGRGYTLFLASNEAVLTLVKPSADKSAPSPTALSQVKLAGQPQARLAVVRLQLAGANRNPRIAQEDELPTKSNYFIGNDPAKWRTNIPNYRKVRYQDIYPGIDLVYYGSQRQLEHDFVVAPGADPGVITLAVRGPKKLRLDADGNLVMKAGSGELRLLKPEIYQVVNGARRHVSGHYALKGRNKVGFRIAGFDRHRSLVIDPVLSYSTYLGGSSIDYAFGIAVDSSGSAYVTGETQSADFPTENPIQGSDAGFFNVFVSKLAPDGSALLYSTYLGGSGSDEGWAIAVDSSGNAYVTGVANSADFPTANAIQGSRAGIRDAFVTKLAPDGSALLYSTYLGGSTYDYGYAVAADTDGNAYVAGETVSTDFPVVNAMQGVYGGGDSDGFVAKLAPDGSALLYSTYLGGTDYDYSYGVAVDSNGYAVITGQTDSTDFPTVDAIQTNYGGWGDAFLTRLAADGSAVYSTYLGGNSSDSGIGVAVDSSGNAYVTGGTSSSNFPTANPIQGSKAGSTNAFVSKLAPDGSALLYSTYLGGSISDQGQAIAVDASGNAYVAGSTSSTDFPIQDSFQSSYGGSTDAFVAKLAPDGSALLYSAYLGGSSSEGATGIAADADGNAYVSGYTQSTDFPTQNAIQSSFGGSVDAFVAKIGPPAPVLSIDSTSLNFTAIEGGSNPAAQAISVTNSGTGTLNWTASKTQSWLSLDSASGAAPSTIHASVNVAGLTAGTYHDTITVTATGVSGSPAEVAVTLVVTSNLVLSVDPLSLSFTATLGGSNPAAQNISIANSGSGTLNWTASKTQSWLSLDSASGAAPSTIHASVDTAGLSAGTYHDTITVSATGASDSPAEIAVTLVVAPNLALSVDPLTLSFTATLGGSNPAAQTISTAKTGSGTLNWTASKTQSWLSLDGASGAAPSLIHASVDTAGLSAGTYHDTITVAANGAANSPQEIAVTLTVQPAEDFELGTTSGGSYSGTVTAGSSAVYNLSVTGSGFSGSVSFACFGAPTAATCSVSPNPMSVSGSEPAPFTVTIATTARTTVAGTMAAPGGFPWSGWETSAFLGLGVFILMIGAPRRRRLAFATLVLCVGGLAGCGGGRHSTTTTPTTQGTPAGTYTVVLTATSGSISHTKNLTLTVR